jgi:hypothetical protein
MKMNGISTLGPGITVMKMLSVRVNWSQGSWAKPNNYRIKIQKTQGRTILALKERLWTDIPSPVLKKLIVLERSVFKILAGIEGFLDFERREVPEGSDNCGIFSISGPETAEVNIEKLLKILTRDPNKNEIISVFFNAKGAGLSRKDAVSSLRDQINKTFEELVTNILDQEVSGPKYKIEEMPNK